MSINVQDLINASHGKVNPNNGHIEFSSEQLNALVNAVIDAAKIEITRVDDECLLADHMLDVTECCIVLDEFKVPADINNEAIHVDKGLWINKNF